MKVLVYNPLVAVWRPRLPTVLSVTQELIDDGHDVVLIGCDRSVKACTANLDHTRAICGYCVTRRRQGYGLLTGPFREQTLHDYVDAALVDRLLGSSDDVPDLATLRELRYGPADVGYAAYSSYAYVARDPSPDFSKRRIARVIQHLINTGKLVYEAMRSAIERERPDRVILHHGRSSIDRAALRACQEAGIDCTIYETALSNDRLLIFKNALPHDIQNFAHTVLETWDNGADDKIDVGKAFFEMRRSGTSTVSAAGREMTTQDRSFIRRQSGGKLPDDWDDRKKIVVMYGTSNDEFIAISSEYEDRIYADQAEALNQVSRGLDGESAHVYFRVHPRQYGVQDGLTEALAAVAAERDNVTVIPADSEISSYALLEGADIVLSFRSTMSMEAAYWGKPSVILSASIYKPLGATYNPSTHEEVMELVRKVPPPKDNLPAIRFGYYQMTSGKLQKHYGGNAGLGKQGYTFDGDPVLVGGMPRIRYLISRERQRFKWRNAV